MNKVIYGLIAICLLAAIVGLFLGNKNTDIEPAPVVCTMDAMQCPDGSYVGRTGPNCEFVCPVTPAVPKDVQVHIESKKDLIQVVAPAPMTKITSPLSLSGSAIGPWFFEANAPVVLTDWDGKIIAESYVTAEGEWMTMNFVSFSGTLDFTSPYKEGDPDFMKRGTLIFKKDNPSDLPENDDSLEIPVIFQ